MSGSKTSKRRADYEQRVQQALAVLGEVSQDTTTPRNIRRSAKEAMDALQASQYSIGVRASNVIAILDEISQDPNMPPYTMSNYGTSSVFLKQ